MRLPPSFGVHAGQAGHVATGLSQTFDKARLQRRTCNHHDGNCLSSRHRGSHRWGKMGDYDGHTATNKLGGKLCGTVTAPLRVADFQRDVATLRITKAL